VDTARLSSDTSNFVANNSIPTGGFILVGRICLIANRFWPMLYACSMDKTSHFYLALLKENPFFYCLDQILVRLLAVLDG
jgi:hypothetical protein